MNAMRQVQVYGTEAMVGRVIAYTAMPVKYLRSELNEYELTQNPGNAIPAQKIDGKLVVLHANEEVDTESKEKRFYPGKEWTPYLAWLPHILRRPPARILVSSMFWRPTNDQHAALSKSIKELTGTLKHKSVVLQDPNLHPFFKLMLKGAAGVFNLWDGSKTKFFDIDNMVGAFEYLGIANEYVDAGNMMIRELQRAIVKNQR